MDMRRRQYENRNPHSLGQRHLRDKQHIINDFHRHTATLADSADVSLSSFGRQYERGIPTAGERQQWDTSWQGALTARMHGRGGSGPSWDQWQAAKYGDDQWDDWVKEKVLPEEIERIKRVVSTFSVGSWYKAIISQHLKTNRIDTNGKVNIALEHLNRIEGRFSNNKQYNFVKEALQKIKDEIIN